MGLAGEVCLTRKFGYPGQIDSFERVWLTIADIKGTASISLNGSKLASEVGRCEFDVTSLLRQHNCLEFALADDAGLLGEVALEVRCAVVLRNPQALRATGELVVTGELVGTWPEPFDLYFFVDDVQVDYQSIRTSGKTTPFRAVLARNDSPRDAKVRIDLIQGSLLWSSEVAP
jgi:hypothetical protein